MKIKLLINKKYLEPEIVICNNEKDKEIEDLYNTISQAVNEKLKCYTDGSIEMVPCDSIVRIYSEKQRVYAETKIEKYILHKRIYELEEELSSKKFVRISNSEIVNIKKIKRLDTSLTGTICMYLDGDKVTYVSRRYVSKIKKVLGI
ncbi:MAG: LytTR family DNA-binding domain-containing protein [Clostridium sp.]|nr:LytTR family DNA-binding domain-containing protein [Clostridium sp.]